MDNNYLSSDLSRIKSLTTDQYDQCRERAIERVKTRIGGKPNRSDFRRELSPLWTVLDLLALVVFVPAFMVSSIHIITHMGKLAADSYSAVSQATAGTIIGRDLYTAAHQWAFIFLAEGAMILFLVMFGMSKDGWRKWVYFVLAVAALLFVFVANWQSGMGALESLLAPVFTVGIGLKLEHLITQSMQRRAEVDARYLEALTLYETSSQDATQHPDFMPMLRQEIWQKLISLQTNRDFRDALPSFKAAAVQRETQRDTWAYELPQLSPVPMNGHASADFLAETTPIYQNGMS